MVYYGLLWFTMVYQTWFTMVSLWFHYGFTMVYWKISQLVPLSSMIKSSLSSEDGDLGDRDQRWGDALETIRRGMGKG